MIKKLCCLIVMVLVSSPLYAQDLPISRMFDLLRDKLNVYLSMDGRDEDEYLGVERGTLVFNNPDFPPGRVGRALRIEGFPSYALIRMPYRFNQRDEFAVAAWVKQEGHFEEDEEVPIISDSDRRSGWVLSISRDGFSAAIPASGNRKAMSKSALSRGVWYHVIMVYNYPTLSLYVNGSLADQVRLSKRVNPCYCGVFLGRGFNRYDSYFNGLIDEVYIFREALTPNELSLFYQRAGQPLSRTEKEEFRRRFGRDTRLRF